MDRNEPPKLDNGAGGSQATKTGKPERVGESGDEPINLIFGEIQSRPMDNLGRSA